MSTDNKIDDHKPCNCKKTRCLKLYCGCFAAGSYCLEDCSCQGCFNNPDYEDSLQDARQQIQLRNPRAFPLEDADQAKHKKGCNCRRSMCQQKYCECFQANAGCTHACRCEGCQNVHGIKPGYNVCDESGSVRDVEEKRNDPRKKELEPILVPIPTSEFLILKS